MNTYIIILKLTSREELYTNLLAYLKTATQWARPMAGVWIIRTSNTVAGIRDGVRSRIGSQDGVLVMDVSKKGWGTSNITKVVTDWMKKNI